jgi:hypothetical protein
MSGVIYVEHMNGDVSGDRLWYELKNNHILESSLVYDNSNKI